MFAGWERLIQMKLKVGSEFGGTVVDEKGVFCLAFFVFVFVFFLLV